MTALSIGGFDKWEEFARGYLPVFEQRRVHWHAVGG